MHLLLLSLLAVSAPPDEPFKNTNLHVEHVNMGDSVPFSGFLMADQDAAMFADRLESAESGVPRIVVPSSEPNGFGPISLLGAALIGAGAAVGGQAARKKLKAG